jgi:hypothetical protein
LLRSKRRRKVKAHEGRDGVEQDDEADGGSGGEDADVPKERNRGEEELEVERKVAGRRGDGGDDGDQASEDVGPYHLVEDRRVGAERVGGTGVLVGRKSQFRFRNVRERARRTFPNTRSCVVETRPSKKR